MNFLKIMEIMGIIIDSSAYDLALLRDKVRLRRSKCRPQAQRIQGFERREQRNDFYEVEEGVLYNLEIDD